MHYTIKKPIITEKNSMLAESGTYVFEVDRKATKVEVRKAIEKLFRVKVISVRTAICRSRTGRNKYGITPVQYWKKAMVKVAPGEKIALFEGA